MSERYLRDNDADRALGALWEERFCELAAWYGKAFHAFQLGRRGAARWQKGDHPALLPDITILTAPGEHHEVKHKNPTHPRRSSIRAYGWETYRLRALVAFQVETQQPVFYSIHDWEAAGVRHSDDAMPNRVHDWRIVDIGRLDSFIRSEHLASETIGTWVNGHATKCPGYYWPVSLWTSLDACWGLPW